MELGFGAISESPISGPATVFVSVDVACGQILFCHQPYQSSRITQSLYFQSHDEVFVDITCDQVPFRFQLPQLPKRIIQSLYFQSHDENFVVDTTCDQILFRYRSPKHIVQSLLFQPYSEPPPDENNLQPGVYNIGRFRPTKLSLLSHRLFQYIDVDYFTTAPVALIVATKTTELASRAILATQLSEAASRETGLTLVAGRYT